MIFADSFFYISLQNPKDQHNNFAKQIFWGIRDKKITHLITTSWVLIEVADAFSGSNLRKSVWNLLDDILNDPITYVITDHDPWFHRGLNLYASRSDKAWSLTDCISFEVMKAHGITEALTGDHHFTQAGFEPLITMEIG
jgi:predicted nucleic acid-binding protein